MIFNKEIRLETPRLILRPYTVDDVSEIFNIMKDREMFSYTNDDPWKSIEDANNFIELVLWLYDLNHETFRHYFAITDKSSGRIIGSCGVGGVDYDRSKNEIFYHIGKDYWMNGYATEAGKAMLSYAFEELHLEEIIGCVHKENKSSNRVMAKLNLNQIGVIGGLGEDYGCFNGQYLYRIRKDDYYD